MRKVYRQPCIHSCMYPQPCSVCVSAAMYPQPKLLYELLRMSYQPNPQRYTRSRKEPPGDRLCLPHARKKYKLYDVTPEVIQLRYSA